MKGARVVNDGLWRCLCPSWERPIQSRPVWRPIPRSTTRLRTSAQRRCFGVESLGEAMEAGRRADEFRKEVTRKEKVLQTKLVEAGARGTRDIDEVLLAPTPPTKETVDRASIDVIIGALKRLRDPEGYVVNPGQDCDRFERILQLVKALIAKGHPRDWFVYECMIDAMADPRGSAQSLQKLLTEMEKVGIHPSARICHSALAALAVHPSYALRQQVLDTMQAFWHTDEDPSHNVLVAMLREGQHELAYDKLMTMGEEGQVLPLWLYDVFIVEFGCRGFLDEMLSLLVRRKESKSALMKDSVEANLTYYCLDLCSCALHYQGTYYAWMSCVKDGAVNPSDGMLENVLATASREGDVSLAAEVHGIISERKRVQIHHYDALIEAFVNNGDLRGALRILCIMEENGLKVLREHTRELAIALSKDMFLLQKAHTALLDFAKDARVPVGALSVILEVAAKEGQYAIAQSLYQEAETLTGYSPNARAIEDMIIATDESDHLRAYINDYKTLVPEDHKAVGRLGSAYNKLVQACLDFEEWGLALRFAESFFLDSPGSKQHEIPVWLNRLTTLAVQNEHAGIWKIYDQCVKSGNRLSVNVIERVAKRERELSAEGQQGKVEAILEASMPSEDIYEQMQKGRRGDSD